MGDSMTEVDDFEKRNGSQSCGNGANLVVKLEARDETSRSVARRAVDIYASRQSSVQESGPASRSVRSHPIANQMWDQEFYLGSLVAWSSKYLAYALKGRSGPVVRVIDPATSNRTLLKGMVGAVADLAFAGSSSDCLACVDEAGSLFVWKIRHGQDDIKADMRLYVVRNYEHQSEESLTRYHRLMWCPQSPLEHDAASDDEDEDDGLPYLAVTNGNLAEVWDIGLTSSAQVGDEPVSRHSLRHGVIVISDAHGKPITDVSLSPDGNVLATASLDGHVKFWDVQKPNSDPKCLHDWEPHQGRPVNRILFCDNHIDQDSNLPFWRFLLTGTDMNKELKLWCTVTWQCLQTVRFHPHDGEEVDNQHNPLPCLQMAMDLSASHLVLSDIKRKVAYVVRIQQDLDSGIALMTSISEFILSQPLLSFAVANVEIRDQAQDEDDDMLSGDVLVPVASSVGEGVSVTRVLLKMYCIHTRSMQELTLRFLLSQAIDIKMALEENVESLTDDVLDQSSGVNGSSNTESEKPEKEQVDEQLVQLGEPVKLMAPGEFTIPCHTSLPAGHAAEGITSGLESITTSTVSLTSSLSLDEETSKTSAAQAYPHSSLDSVSQLKSSSLPPFASLMAPMSPIMTVGGLCRPSPIGLFQPTLAPKTPDRTVNEIGNTLDVGTESSTIDPGNDKEEDDESLPELESSPVAVSVTSSISDEQPKKDDQTTEDDLGGQRPLPLFPSASGHDQFDRLFEESEKEVDRVLSLDGKADREEQTELMMPLETEEPALDESRSNLESPTLPLPLDDPLLKDISPEEVLNDPATQAVISRATISIPSDDELNVDMHQSGIKPASLDTSARAHELLSSNHSQSQLSVVGEPLEHSVNQREEIQDMVDAGSLDTQMVQEDRSHQVLSPLMVATVTDSHTKELLEEVLRCVAASQSDITCMTQVLHQHRQDQQLALAEMQQKVTEVEMNLSHRVDGLLATYNTKQKEKIDAGFRDQQLADKQRQDRLMSTVQQSVATSLQGRVDRAVKQEIKNTVIPTINKIFNPVQEQINQTLAQKLTAADQLLRDSIAKMVKSKPVVDAIGQATSSILQRTLMASFQETFQSTVLPAFESACQAMYRQMNDTFQRGTEDYVRQFQRCVTEQEHQLQAAVDRIPHGVQPLIESCQSLKDSVVPAMSAAVQEAVEQHLGATMERMQHDVVEGVKEAVHQEVTAILPLRSDVQTDGPAATRGKEQVKAHLLQLVNQSKIAQAFQEALTANDLSLVILVCEAVNHEQLFGQQPCPLDQPILLSLIQQLCCDLTAHLELKQKYIESALLALDTRHEVTSQHLPSVVGTLIHQLRGAIQSIQASDPTSPLLKPLRMLQMAAQSFLPR